MSTEAEYLKQEDFLHRSNKLREIADLGINPYPYEFPGTSSVEEIKKEYMSQSLGNSEDATNKAKPPLKGKNLRSYGAFPLYGKERFCPDFR